VTAGKLWIEMTIAGSVYVASLFFWVMGLRYPCLNLECLAQRFDPFLTYIAVAGVALSYIFGFVAHRAIQIVNGRLWKCGLFRKLVENIDLGVVRDWDDKRKQKPKALQKRMAEEALIWALDPQRIHRELDFQFAQVALLRSLAWSVPWLFISISFWFWRFRTVHNVLAFTYWICFLVFYVFLFLAFRRQSSQYEMIRSDAVAGGRRHMGCLVPSLSPTYGPGGTVVTIKGIDFGKASEKNKITFEHPTTHTSVNLNATIWEPTWILVSVPADAATGVGKFHITISGASDSKVGFEMKFTCPFMVLSKQ
jgi:hypothetical protein